MAEPELISCHHCYGLHRTQAEMLECCRQVNAQTDQFAEALLSAFRAIATMFTGVKGR